MPLPSPNLVFTIPSLYEDTTIDCRIYHPRSFLYSFDASSRIQGAIIAHPYAPLGGCFDDPVVGLIGKEFLKNGWIVGTFNFRGAGGSKGNTTWTGRGELADYESFAGCFVHYLNGLRIKHNGTEGSDRSTSTVHEVLTPDSISAEGNQLRGGTSSLQVVFGGYSYGSLIVTKLPLTNAILSRFANTTDGTAAAEILLRARHLASDTNAELEAAREAREIRVPSKLLPNSPASPVIFGGEETPAEARRMSKEGHRSLDIRRSLDVPRLIKEHRRSKEGARHLGLEQATTQYVPRVETSYLLVSPLMTPVSSLAMLSFFNQAKGEGLEKLVHNKTLAVFGDRDSFTSIKKLRPWAEKLRTDTGSKFTYRAVHGAGHFWREEGVEGELRERIREWMSNLL